MIINKSYILFLEGYFKMKVYFELFVAFTLNDLKLDSIIQGIYYHEIYMKEVERNFI